MTDRHIIWSNYTLDFEAWKRDLQVDYPYKSDFELRGIMHEFNNDYLNDERINLNIQLPREILVIADIGRWNGRFSGYKEISNGNIKDCLYSDCDYTEWFIDNEGEFRCDAVHHDGKNHYLYRGIKENATDDQIYELKNKILEGDFTQQDLEAVTDSLGTEIAKVYGFELCKQQSYKTER